MDEKKKVSLSKLKAGTYYLSCGNVVHGGVNAPVIVFEDETSSVAYASLEQGMKKEIQLKKDCQFIALYSNGYDYYGSAGFTATVEDLMLVASNEIPGGYTPYIGQTNTMTLPETVYGGEVDAVSGAGESQYNMVNIRMEKLNYNGTISAMLGFASSNILNDIQLPPSNRDTFDGVCDCLPIKSSSEINSGTIGLGVSASGDIYMRAEGLYSKEAYAAKFPDGVNVCYKVATPTSFSATGNASVKALSGVNTVMTDADSATVTGRADPIKRITDLEAAVASIN